jgi:phage terminase Nu1 subunit (DNA packaging protein)
MTSEQAFAFGNLIGKMKYREVSKEELVKETEDLYESIYSTSRLTYEQARIEAMEQRINQLESELDALELKSAKLESENSLLKCRL